MTPVRIRHDQHDLPGCLIGPRLVLTAGQGPPGDRVVVRVLGTDRSAQVVWRAGSTGAALVAADTDIAPARVRWGSVPDMLRVPCAVLDVGRRDRITVTTGPEGPTADTRDIDRDVSGAVLACGDLLLGVVLPGTPSSVTTADDLLADEGVRGVLSDHGLPNRAIPVGASLPEPDSPDSAHAHSMDGNLERIAAASPPADPVEHARLADLCLTLIRAEPTEAMRAAGLADGYGPLHAAIDRVIADPDTPLDVSVELYEALPESMEHVMGDLCAGAARRLEAEASSAEEDSVVRHYMDDAYDLALEAYEADGRMSAYMEILTDLRAALRGRQEGGPVVASAVGEVLVDHAASLLEKGRFRDAAEAFGAAAEIYREYVEHGQEEHRAAWVRCLADRETALSAASRPDGAVESASGAPDTVGDPEQGTDSRGPSRFPGPDEWRS